MSQWFKNRQEPVRNSQFVPLLVGAVHGSLVEIMSITFSCVLVSSYKLIFNKKILKLEFCFFFNFFFISTEQLWLVRYKNHVTLNGSMMKSLHAWSYILRGCYILSADSPTDQNTRRNRLVLFVNHSNFWHRNCINSSRPKVDRF